MRLLRWAVALPAGAFLSWLMILCMAAVVPIELWQGDYPLALMALLAVGVSLLPGLLRRSCRVVLPWELELLVVLQLYLHTFFGVWLRFYDSLWFWDRLLHLKGTLIVSFLGFLGTYALHAAGRVRLSQPLLVLFTVCLGNALGTCWEIVELTVDKTLGKNTQYGLDNTMWDLIHNFAGSLLAAGLGCLYLRWTRPEERYRLTEPLGKLLGTYLGAEPPMEEGKERGPTQVGKTCVQDVGGRQLGGSQQSRPEPAPLQRRLTNLGRVLVPVQALCRTLPSLAPRPSPRPSTNPRRRCGSSSMLPRQSGRRPAAPLSWHRPGGPARGRWTTAA